MTRSRPNIGGMSKKTMIALGVVVCAAGAVGYRSWSGPETKLLNAKSLTPEQIRQIATRLIIHEDIQVRMKATDRLAQEGAAAVPVLKDLSWMPDRAASAGVRTH